MEERSTSTSPKAGTFEELESLVTRQLLTCRSLSRAVSSTVAVLSEAGSGLQRGSSAGDTDAHNGNSGAQLLEARLQEEDPLTAGAGRVLLHACGSLGVALVSLAATLSGDVITPLEDMRNIIEADRGRSQAELARLQQQAKMCSNALSESKLRKDKALEELQTALAQREAAEDPSKASQGGAAWLRAAWTGAARSDNAAEAAESKVMQAASMQTAIVEEMGLREDAETEARLRAEAGFRDFQVRLHCVDFARKSLLQSLLGRCAAAWDDAARALQAVAEQFRGQACELSQRKPRMPKSSGSMPDWAVKAAAAAAAEEESRQAATAKQPAQASSPSREAREVEAEIKEAQNPLPRKDADSAPATPASKEWLSKEWERVQARDLELLERESALQTLQDNLEEQQARLLERRRSMARDQALSMSMLEHDSPDSAQVFAIDGSPARPTAAPQGESGGSGGSRGLDDAGNPVEQEEEEGPDEEEEVDAVWDMDWAQLPGSATNRAGSAQDEAAAASDGTISRTASGELADGYASSSQAESEATAPKLLARSTSTTAAAEGSPLGPSRRGAGHSTDDKSADASELQRKLEERRRRSDESNGKENGGSQESPSGTRKIEKGRMPGVHPKMAEKLEERRRRLDAEELAGGLQPAATPAAGTA